MTATPTHDIDDLRARFGAVYTGAVTDVLYELGHGAQTLPPAIKPIAPGLRVTGPAFTVQWKPYVPAAEEEERAWEVLSAVPAGHVMVGAAIATDRAALGDLAMAHMKANGVAGAVIDGGCRDIDLNLEIGLPIFCAFKTPQDLSHGRGSITASEQEIQIGEVRIRPGDFVVGDSDGVVIIPAEVVGTTLERVEALVRRETAIRAALLAGSTPEAAFADNP